MRVPDEFIKFIFFICVDVRDGENTIYKPVGTGFFVCVPSASTSIVYGYMVTARHVIDEAKRNGFSIYVRLNLINGGVELIQIREEWYIPDDEAIDIAVLPISFNDQLYDTRYLHNTSFLTSETINTYNIGPGDDLMVAGLFTYHTGEQRNLPILRTGIIAAMPEEPLIDERSGYKYDAYLAEVRSIGGLSGSPVFVCLEPGRVLNGVICLNREIYLMGLVRGHWDERRYTSRNEGTSGNSDPVNMGVAIVTPIYHLIDLLEKGELAIVRRSKERKIAQTIEESSTRNK